MAAEPEQRDGGAWCQRLRRGVGGAEVEQGGGGGGSGGSGGSVDRVAFSHRHSRSSTMLEAIRRIKRHRIVAENNGGGDGGHGGRRRGRSTGIRRAADEDRDDAANDDAFGADVEHEHDHDQANANAVAPAGFHSGDGTFRLLLVGADRVEGTSPLETADVFKGLLRRSRRGRGRIVGGNGIGKGEREGGSGGGGGGGGEGGSPRGRGGIQNEVTASANDASGADEPEELEEDEDAMEGIDRVDILLVGPNVMLDEGVEEGVFHTVPSAQKTRELSPRGGDEHRPIELRVAYHVGLYHDMKRPDDDDDDDDDEGIIAAGDKNNDEGHRESIIATTVDGFSPDLAVAFNAGMWGYSPDEWRPTVERVLHEDGCPLVVTGYTLEMEEAENDEDALRDMLSVPETDAEEVGEEGDAVDARKTSSCVGDGFAAVRVGSAATDVDEENENTSGPPTVEWLWEAELNPSRSLLERELEFDLEGGYVDRKKSFMSENCGWQCLVGVGKK